MATIDLKKVHRDHYRAGDEPELVEVPERTFLAIDGAGDPNTAVAYRDAVASLYTIAYALRRAVEERTGDAYVVMPLEGLWWADDMQRFSLDRRDDWRWKMMIAVPGLVTDGMFAETAPRVVSDKGLAGGGGVRLLRFHEGRAAQVMHHGPYATEVESIGRLHDFIAASGLRLAGTHHEIYLTDPRRIAPERNRTILRQPVGAP